MIKSTLEPALDSPRREVLGKFTVKPHRGKPRDILQRMVELSVA